MQYAAIRLFVERVRAAGVPLEITPGNAAAIVEVCRRLDGIPLAIELAAARVRSMRVEQIAARLDDRFQLLTGGSRTALARHQTLRATMEWSDALLSERERLLMRRLSVFAGGWTLDAAEVVCAGEPVHDGEVLELLTSLVEKSLVVYEPQERAARYRSLETVRQYYRDRRLEAAEADDAQWRHLEYFLTLAEEAEPHLMGADQGEWLDRLEAEHDNLRAALDWSLGEDSRQKAESSPAGADPATGCEDPSELPTAYCLLPTAALGLRLAAALGSFWLLRRYLTEGRQRLAQALAKGAGTTAERAKALYAAGRLATRQADYLTARSLQEESLALRRDFGDRAGIAASLRNLGLVAYYQGEHGAARLHYEESLAIDRELGDRAGIAGTLQNLGIMAYSQGEYGAARSLYEEGLAISRDLADRSLIATSLQNIGVVASRQGDYATARSFFEESLAIKRELGFGLGIAFSLHDLGRVACKQGEYDRARSFFEESLTMRRELGDRLGIATLLESLADLACEEAEQTDAGKGDGTGGRSPAEATADPARAGWRAARLLGAAEALREVIGAPMQPSDQETHRRKVSRTRALLEAGARSAGPVPGAFAAAWAEGRAMTLERAVAYALGEGDGG